MKAKDLYETQKNSTKQIFDQIKKQQEVELQAINEKLKKLQKGQKKGKRNKEIQMLRIDVNRINNQVQQDVETILQKNLQKNNSIMMDSEMGDIDMK